MSKRGDIITLDNDLNISNEIGRDDEEDQFLRSFSYPRTRCTFLPDDTPAVGEVLILFLARRGVICVRILRLAQEDGVTHVASVELGSDLVSCTQPKATSILKLRRQQRTSRVVNPETSVFCVCHVVSL